MFEGRKQEYAVASPQAVEDQYNYSKTRYIPEGTAKIYIVVQDRTLTNTNDLSLYTGTLVGYTNDTRIGVNWRIGDRYLVKYTMPHRNQNILYLQEVNNGR